MNSNSTSRETAGPAYTSKAPGVQPDAPADVGSDNLGANEPHEEVKKLRRDMAGLADTVARLASQAGGEAAKTVRNVGQTVAAQVGGAAGNVTDAGSDLAASAKEHVKTFASELENMARRNPLGTIAGALLVGVVVGMMSRGRG